MGWRDAAEKYQDRKEQSAEMATASTAGCPDPGTHYVTNVNKGSISMVMLGGVLNSHYAKGYRLAQAFEQGGNTIAIFEHNHD